MLLLLILHYNGNLKQGLLYAILYPFLSGFYDLHILPNDPRLNSARTDTVISERGLLLILRCHTLDRSVF